MGFFSVIKRALGNPVKAVRSLIHNPASKILPKNVRASKAYRKFGRPIIKIGAGIGVGALTGGIGIVGGGLAFSGLSVAGGLAGGVVSAKGGGLGSRGFNPLRQLVLPAIAGGIAGTVQQRIARAGGFKKLLKGLTGRKRVQARAEIFRQKQAILRADRRKLAVLRRRQRLGLGRNRVKVKQHAGIVPGLLLAGTTLAATGNIPIALAAGAAGLIMTKNKGS